MPLRRLKVTPKIYVLMAIAILLPVTAWGTLHNFRITMMLLTGFALAYLSKGMRRSPSGLK